MKRFLTFSGFVTAIVLLFGGVFLLTRLMQFRGELADLKKAGFPVSIADLSSVEGDGVDATSQFNDLIDPLGAFETEMYKVHKELDDEVVESTIELFDSLNESYPTVYPLIAEIADADFVRFGSVGPSEKGLEIELGEHQQRVAHEAAIDRIVSIRSCARVLVFKSKVLAAQDKPDEAMQATMQIFKIANTFREYPTLVAQLVRHACRAIAIASAYDILSFHEISSETQQGLNELLEEFDDASEYKLTLISERAFGCSVLSEMGTVPLAISGKAYIDLLAQELSQHDKEAFDYDDSFAKEISWFDGEHAKMILPALQQVRRANFRTKSQIRGLRVVSALVANSESADKEITKEFLVGLGVPESMAVDTWNEQLMKVKRSGDLWIVYSVGEDLVDDGGDFRAMKDMGVGPEVE